MIYFASYFEPQNHHGEVVSISRSNPDGFVHIPRVVVFCPSAKLLHDWKDWEKQNLSNREELYTAEYREQLRQNWHVVKFWIETQRESEEVITLACWEKSGFCHRNLVAKIVEKHLPHRFGGCDVPCA